MPGYSWQLGLRPLRFKFSYEGRRFLVESGARKLSAVTVFSSSSVYPLGLGSRAHFSVFLLSSHWVRRFSIDQFLLFFLLDIGQEVFSIYT